MSDFPYKMGLLPGQVPVGLQPLAFYAAGALPKAPNQLAAPAGPANGWGMLGNNQYGDCGVAGLQHGFETTATITGEKEVWPTDAKAVSYYLKFTGGQDTGVVLSQYLAHVRSAGYYGQTVKAYAPVAVQDIPTLQTSIWLYGFAYTGITVYDGMQQAFAANETGCTWTTSELDQVDGGHCVPIIGYDDLYLYLVTWGQVVRVTYSCWHAIATEAWAAITGEVAARHGDGRGVSITALDADLDRLAS